MNLKNLLLSWLGGIGLVFLGLYFFTIKEVMWEWPMVFILGGLLLLPPVRVKLPFRLTTINWFAIVFLLFIAAAAHMDPKIEAEALNDFNKNRVEILKAMSDLYNQQKYQEAKDYANKYKNVTDPELKDLENKIAVAIAKEEEQQAAAEKKAQAEEDANEKAADDTKKEIALAQEAIAGAEVTVMSQLKDPDSAQFRDEHVSHMKDGEVLAVCGQVNSKNGFGGYSGFQHFVAVGRSVWFEEGLGFNRAWRKMCENPK